MTVRIAYPGTIKQAKRKKGATDPVACMGPGRRGEALTCRSRKIVQRRMSVFEQNLWRELLSSYQSLKKDLKSVLLWVQA